MFKEKYGACTPREELPRYETVLEKRMLDTESGVKKHHSGKGIAPLVWGIIGLVAWLFPLIGLVVGIFGLISAIKGLKHNDSKVMTIYGLVFTCISLTLTSIIIISILRILLFR